MRISAVVLSLAAVSFAFGGCCRPEQHAGDLHAMRHGDAHVHAAHLEGVPWMSVNQAVAVIYPTKGHTVSGTIHFDESADGLHIFGTVSGLEPNSTHAIHIHQYGDQTSADGSSAGGHYNPEGHRHGAPDAAEHHAGDLGNITANASGVAKVDVTVHDISIGGMQGKDPIIGRGLVIHARPDDFSQPVGNAGGRIGVGVIGVAKPVSQ